MGKDKVIQFNKDFKKKEPEKPSKRGFGLFNEGMCFYNQDKNELALKKFKAAEKEGYESAVMFANMAWLYGYLGESDKVKEYAQKSIDIDSEYAFPYSLLGRYYHITKNDDEQALKYYLIAEKYDCDIVIMYRATSELYLDAGDFLKAVKYASKAIKLDPKEAYSYYWKGYVYYRNQDFKSALKYYEKAEGFGENFNSLFYEMSYCYSMLENHKKGIEYANKYIFIDKKDFWGYYRKGFAYFQSGDDSNALEPFLMAEKLGCKEPDMYSRLGFLYSIKNNNKQALKWIRKGYKLADGDVDNDYYCSYISILATAKQYKKALDLSDKALEKYPDDYRLLLSKISILQCKKRYKEAEEVTNRLLAVDSEDPYSIFYEALMYSNRPKKERDYHKIISLIMKIKDANIEDFGGRKAMLASSYYEIKDYEKSIFYFVEFFEMPDNSEWLDLNLKEVKKYFKKIYKKFPNDERLISISKRFPQVL